VIIYHSTLKGWAAMVVVPRGGNRGFEDKAEARGLIPKALLWAEGMLVEGEELEMRVDENDFPISSISDKLTQRIENRGHTVSFAYSPPSDNLARRKLNDTLRPPMRATLVSLTAKVEHEHQSGYILNGQQEIKVGSTVELHGGLPDLLHLQRVAFPIEGGELKLDASLPAVLDPETVEDAEDNT
jgi:hypothetical protein